MRSRILTLQAGAFLHGTLDDTWMVMFVFSTGYLLNGKKLGDAHLNALITLQ